MKIVIELSVNGDSYEVAVEPQTTLTECLRDHLGLMGTKEACGTGECGSCTVWADGRPILSCLVLAADCQQMEITTIEGYPGHGTIKVLQQKFQEKGAVQCGFCTSGMILTSAALLKKNSRPTEDEIRKALEGNLCRCTGYNKIFQAVQAASEQLSGESVEEAAK